MKKSWTMLLGLMAGVFVACTPAPAKGVLSVTISGLPTGVDAAVTATSSTGVTLSFAKTNSLDADVGTYTITAGDVTSGSSTYIGTVTGSPATVTETTPGSASVSYTLKPPVSGSLTKRLYASGNGDRSVIGTTPNNGVLFLTPGDLNGTGGGSPATQFKANGGTLEVGFDTTGNQYQASKADTSILSPTTGRQTLINGFSSSTATNNVLTPVRLTITNGWYPLAAAPSGYDYSLFDPSDIALQNGNLWIADPASKARYEFTDGRTIAGRLVCISKGDLDAAAAKVSPNNNIDTPGNFFFGSVITGITSMAFDKSGNLWVAAPGRLSRIKAASLSCTNLTDPPGPVGKLLSASDVDINYTISGLTPTDLAVEQGATSTLLWVANTTNILKVNYSNATTASTTAIPVTGSATGISSAVLDSNNQLWVGVNSSATSGKILLLPASPTGAVAPTKTFTTAFGVGSLAFQP